nr:ionotropic glutamate receptor 6 [Achelura yunnanensis]
MCVKVLVIVVLSAACVASDEPSYTIGAIFHKDPTNTLQSAFELSAEIYNFNVSIREVSKRGNILEVKQHVCSLAEEGVIGIIDGTGGRTSEHIQALTDMMEIPHVMIDQNDLMTKNWSVLNLYPSSENFNKILVSIITQKDWSNFTLLYVEGNSLQQAADLLRMGNETDRPTVAVRELGGDDYRDVLTNAKQHGYTNFVLACPSEYIEQVLLHAQQVGLMADEHAYVIISPDLFTLDLERYRYGGVNMTGFRMVDLKQNIDLWKFTDLYNKKALKSFQPEELKTSVLLIHDAVLIFFFAIDKVAVTAKSLSCDNFDTWEDGSTLINFMKTNKVKGLTNYLSFDGLGQRIDVAFDILELTTAGNHTIGKFENGELEKNRPQVASGNMGAESVMANKTFIVLISDTAPYGYKKESVVKLEGNDRYEGFSIDLIEKLSEILGFNYIFEMETDYGSYKNDTGKSTGMIQKLREDKAHFVICDFTMNSERKNALDFSMPFMSLGIGIMYKEPRKQPPEMFSFMAVFSKEVWYYMMLIQLGLGLVMIFVGRISHREWQNIVPCIETPEELTNQFSFANSVWLIIGSVMQQGSEIAPIAVAPRMITSIWWFFTMVMVASYTGTLVAFLTVENNIFPFSHAKELPSKNIPYGAKAKGATASFFEKSTDDVYKKMYKTMAERGGLVANNDEGVKRAENSNFAFFAESTSIEYYGERHCDLKMVGNLLDSKSYGIGMKKDSIYKKYIDQALLQLKEQNVIQKLKDTWWKEKRGGGKCEVIQNKEPKQLGLKNMIGSFVVLGVGCVIGLVISIADMLWGVFKKTVKYHTTFKYELIEELKFALKFNGDIKPVKRPKSSDMTSSAEALAEAEGKDEVRSLPSIRSGRSSDTNKTHHSHSSRHSPSDLSIAFARRREYS